MWRSAASERTERHTSSSAKEGRDKAASTGYIAFHHCVNAKPSDRLTAAIEKDVFILMSASDHGAQRTHRVRPQGTTAQLVAFAVDPY